MLKIRKSLSLDDVLLVPKYSDIKSRSEVDVGVKIGKFAFSHPVIPANMKTICGKDMAKAVIDSGGLAILHRFMPLEEQIQTVLDLRDDNSLNHLAVSVGVKQEDKENLVKFLNIGVQIFCIDIAHGDSLHCVEMVQFIKKSSPSALVIAGNVATAGGAERLWRAGAEVVKAGIGGGCFGAGTRVLMANGFYKNIEEITPGEYVINKNGKPVKVIDAFSTGIKKVSRVENNSFYKSTYVTPDHEFWVGDLNSVSLKTIANKGYSRNLDKFSKTVPKQSKYKWKTIKDCQQDVFLFPKNISYTLPETFRIDIQKRTRGNWRTGNVYEKDSQIIPSYDSGYLFGTFLGDGNASCTENNGSHSGVVKWHFGLEESSIAEKVITAIKKVFNKTAIIQKMESTLDVVFYYKPLADILNAWGKKSEKHLPQELLINNKEYLQGLYDGLLDSDGHYAKDGRNSVSNTSIHIIELFNVLNSIIFNYIPNNDAKAKTTGNLENCNIDNCKDSYQSRTLKNFPVRFTKDYYIVKKMLVEETNIEMTVYDITVDCDTHSFIANNMIVHNSLCSTRVETGNGVCTLDTISQIYERRLLLEEEKNRGLYPNEKHTRLHFIVDGGLKNAGDLVKGLCFADMAMMGNVFSGSTETPGEVMTIDGVMHKSYVGSSTHKGNHVEGVKAIVPTKGSYKDILTGLLEGLKSGCSYQGVRNLDILKENPEFIEISSSGIRESHPHDVRIVK